MSATTRSITQSSITDSQIHTAGILAYACTIPGTIVCSLILLAYGWISLSSTGRKCLNRVSFRLLVYALVFNVFFGIAYAATPAHPGPGCNIGAFLVNLNLCFATFFTTCIAINLQLVLVHGFAGQKLERFYIFGTTFLSLAINIPALALNQFGWNDLSGTCWYQNPNDKLRLRWIIGTQSFWISLAATIETVCSTVVLLWMYNCKRDIFRWFNPFSSSRSESSKERIKTSKSSSSFAVANDPRYRMVIIRIAFYPIVSLVMNHISVALDLNVSIGGVHTQQDFRLLIVDLTLYGLRPLAYGVLATTDPSFITALRKIRAINQVAASVEMKMMFASNPVAANSTYAEAPKVEAAADPTLTDVELKAQAQAEVDNSIDGGGEMQEDIQRIMQGL